MELYHSNRVWFDDTSHSYLLDEDRLLMGVTGLIKKHGIGGAGYVGVNPEILRRAAEEGTAIHRELQDYENGVTIFASELIDEYKKLGLKFIESEYPVSDFDVVASAIDMVYEGSAPNSVILADIKCTDKYHRRYVEWQLGGYKILFERQNPGIKVEALLCLHIDKKKRTIRGLYPVNGVSEAEWDALIQAEKDGLIYIDENTMPDCMEIITEEEAYALVQNANKIAELETTLKILKEADEAEREKLLAYMEENNLTNLAAPGGVFKRKAAYTQTRIDSKALQEKYPAVYAKVTKQVNIKGSVIFNPNK